MGAIKDSVMSESGSPIRKYQDTIIGSRSLLRLILFETSQLLFGNLAGALGLAVRQIAFRQLFGHAAKGVVIGRGVVLRHPKRVVLGRGVVVDDGCCLDAISQAETAIDIGEGTMLGMGTKISAKMGTVRIGPGCGFGSNITVHSSAGGSVSIGKQVLVAGHAYLGGGQYHTDRTDVPIAEQGHVDGLHLTIGDHCWIGANATVINGVTIGRDVVIAAGAVVTRDVPDYAVVGGVPAKILRTREPDVVTSAAS